MKDKLNRLAKGIMEDERPVVHVTPGSISGTLPAGRKLTFTIEIECENGKSVKGAAFCDDFRVTVQTDSFLGRVNDVILEADTTGLEPGDVLSGEIALVTSAGEYFVPYAFTLTEGGVSPADENEPAGSAYACGAGSTSESGSVPPAAAFSTEKALAQDAEQTILMRFFPEDEELFTDACALLIKEDADTRMALEFYKEAIRRDLRLTHLFESFMAAFPEENTEEMPGEVLYYYSYERRPDVRTADKLYANIIKYQPQTSEIYGLYEPAMRDHAMAAVLNRRVNANLAVIYDRMLYPAMLDLKCAAILPDILKSVRFKFTDPAVKNVHARYEGLNTIAASEVKNGEAYLPVYFPDALIELTDDRGHVLRRGGLQDFDAVRLLSRPDLLKRCFELDGSHKMLKFSAVREILARGLRTEEEREVLISGLNSLDLAPALRSRIIRELLKTGGDPAWLDNVSVSEIDAQTGMMAFRGFLRAGRFRDAYIYLRRAGAEKAESRDIYDLVSALFAKNMMPVMEDGTPDRFFACLCVKLFDAGRVSPVILDFLAERYQGSGRKMFAILKVLSENGLPVRELPERTLVTELFTEEPENVDETFTLYLSGGNYKELVLRAYFTLRMSIYFEREQTIGESAFEALEGYFESVRVPEGLPEIYALALTRHYSEKTGLTGEQLELCRKLTDRLIEKELIFPYTKALRKKIPIPASVCETFYVEYRGEPVLMRERILPDEKDWRSVSMKKTWKNIYVAGEVLFLGDELEYQIFDAADEEKPQVTGRIAVKKLHEKGEDRYARINRMEQDLMNGDVANLRDRMIEYTVDTELNKELFRLEQ